MRYDIYWLKVSKKGLKRKPWRHWEHRGKKDQRTEEKKSGAREEKKITAFLIKSWHQAEIMQNASTTENNLKSMHAF